MLIIKQLGAPYAVGDPWNAIATSNCSNADCWDFLGRELDIQSILNVKLYAFTGHPERNFNLLTRKTTSETNNSHFILNRSTDGINFEEIYRVDGAGTSLEAHDYSFEDFTRPNGISYYQIETVDFSGYSEFSHTIALAHNVEGVSNISLYPVPSTDFTTLTFASSKVDEGSVSIYSMDGKLIETQTLEILKGENSVEINTTNLSSGIYSILLTSDNNSSKEVVKLIK